MCYVTGLVEAIRDLLSVKRRNLDHLIRFVVHLVLFLIRIKQHTLEEASVALLEHYVEVGFTP